MLKVYILSLFIATSSTTYKQVDVKVVAHKHTTCDQLLEMNTKIDYLPHGVRYKGERVFMHYCKDLRGNYVSNYPVDRF